MRVVTGVVQTLGRDPHLRTGLFQPDLALPPRPSLEQPLRIDDPNIALELEPLVSATAQRCRQPLQVLDELAFGVEAEVGERAKVGSGVVEDEVDGLSGG